VNHPVLGVPAATRCPYSARSRTSTGQALLSTRSQLAWARSEESATLEVAPGPLTGGCWKMANSATAVASRDLVDRLEQERPGVQVRRGTPLLIDVVIDAADLVRRVTELRGDRFRR